MEANKVYDMIIVGGGPAGYSAALYAARANLNTIILEKYMDGGQMALTHQIDNYPGFQNGIDGFQLALQFKQQAQRFNAKTQYANVTKLHLEDKIKVVESDVGNFYGRSVLIATGASARKLNLKDEELLVGRGVAYCAACDGMFYKDKVVVVIGGGISAVSDALLLSRIAKKVYLVHRRNELRATKIYDQALQNANNIELIFNHEAKEILYDDVVNGLMIEDVNSKQERKLDCDGIFISIGRIPASELVKYVLPLDKQGYIIADESCRTNIDGVYAIGDVRTKLVRQIVTALADGASAALLAEEYLSK